MAELCGESGVAKEMVFRPLKHPYDIENFLYKETFTNIRKEIQKNLAEFGQLKFQMSLQIQLSKLRDLERITIEPHFNSQMKMCLNKDFIVSVIHECINEITSFFEAFNSSGSGWFLDRILQLKLSLCKFVPFKGGNCRYVHRLPGVIKRKKAVLCIDCPQDKCFLYAVLASLHKSDSKNPHRYFQYKRFEKTLNHSFLTYPFTLKALPQFEDNNKLSVNVYAFENILYPLYVSPKQFVRESHQVDLLFHKQHFYCIRSLSRLIGTSVSKHCQKHLICRACLSSYKTWESLETHKRCCKSDGQIFTLPPPGTKKKFTNYRAQYQSPFVFYYDFECIASKAGCKGVSKASKMQKINSHIPISVAVKRVCIIPKFDGELYCYTGLDCVERFVEYLQMQSLEIDCIYEKYSYPIDWTDKALQHFDQQEHCTICAVRFGGNVRKCADHFHLSPKQNYRSALCSRCNLTYAATSHKIPVIAHGGNNYDTKLLLSQYAKGTKKHKLHVIAKNKERFCCMNIDQFIFIDSCAFLGASLGAITEALVLKSSQHFKYVRDFAESKEQLDLLFRKQIFPYQFMDSAQKLNYPTIPPKSEFYDELKDKNITDQDYQHALNVFRVFQCRDFGSYVALYVKLDTLLLADVFQTWREMCYDNYGLEVVKYVSLPSYSFDALFKMTGVEVELISSLDMFNFINASIRGGQCNATHRFARANNKYMSDYDPAKPEDYILYLDITNLYGTMMNHTPMPVSDFRWLSDKEIAKLDIGSLDPKGDRGYFLEVSMLYPESIHDLTSDFPFCPDQISIPPHWWSSYTTSIAETYGHPIHDGPKKLIATVKDKDNYVVHYALLQFYLEKGMILKNIHRVLTFKQRVWMKDYIQYNTKKRQQAKSKFETDLYKLMINAVFGFSLMSHKNRIDFRLVTDKTRFLGLSSKPSFQGFQIINNGLVGVEMKKTKVELIHPLYIGSVILEMAKRYNYMVYYSYCIPMYKQIKLAYHDTDSFLLIIRGQDPYEDILHNMQLFDTSNFDENHPLYSSARKKKLGTIKVETGSKHIKAFCGLRSKSYSILLDTDDEGKKSKGLKGHIVKTLTFQDYVDALHMAPLKSYSFQSIRSIKNNMFTVKASRIGLSPMDDKRYICSNGIDTLPYGHWRIKEGKEEEIFL